MMKKKKKYKKPRKKFDKLRIEEENILIKRYGLKNKREIWKAEAEIKKIRNKAKKLITKSDEEKERLIVKLKKTGFEVNNIADVLGLDKEDLLKRRLQTILVKKKLVTTPGQARQSITHKKVMIGNKKINSPSYIVPIDKENEISIVPLKKKVKKKEERGKEKSEEIKERETNNDKEKESNDGAEDTKVKESDKQENKEEEE